MGLALVAAVKGYRSIFVMPDKMSDEKIRALRALGAEVVVTPTAVEPEDPRSYYSVARRLVEETEGSFYANQYHNPVNPETHYRSTGPELWAQVGDELHTLVCGPRYRRHHFRNRALPEGAQSRHSGGGRGSRGIALRRVLPHGQDRRGAHLQGRRHRRGLHPLHHGFRSGGRSGPGHRPGFLPDHPASRPRGGALRRRLHRNRGRGRAPGLGGGSPGGAGGGARARLRRALPVQDLQRRLDATERFLDSRFAAGRVGDVLAAKGAAEILSVPESAGVREAVALMREHDVSSCRCGTGERFIGVISEATLLQGLLAGGPGQGDASIRAFVRTDAVESLDAESPLDETGADIRPRPDHGRQRGRPGGGGC